MSSFLTDGRQALIDALKADAELGARVRTWFEFGPGLSERHNVEPAACPALTVLAAGARRDAVANVQHEIVQTLRVEAAVAGQDAAPCEELVEAVLGCVESADEDCLGLSDDGLAAVRARSVSWAPLPQRSGPRLVWKATVEIELLWRRPAD